MNPAVLAAAQGGVQLTHFEAIMAAFGALVVAAGVIAGGLKWIYRQGVSSQKLVDAMEGNTVATGKLSGAFEKFSEQAEATLTDHEHRLTRTEDKLAAAVMDVADLKHDARRGA